MILSLYEFSLRLSLSPLLYALFVCLFVCLFLCSLSLCLSSFLPLPPPPRPCALSPTQSLEDIVRRVEALELERQQWKDEAESLRGEVLSPPSSSIFPPSLPSSHTHAHTHALSLSLSLLMLSLDALS